MNHEPLINQLEADARNKHHAEYVANRQQIEDELLNVKDNQEVQYKGIMNSHRVHLLLRWDQTALFHSSASWKITAIYKQHTSHDWISFDLSTMGFENAVDMVILFRGKLSPEVTITKL